MRYLFESSPGYTIASLCSSIGYTKQAYYKHDNSVAQDAINSDLILKEIYSIRADMPNLSGKKIYKMLQKLLPDEIRIGRDATYDLMRSHGLIRPMVHRRIRTTITVYKLEYTNLIHGMLIDRPNLVWVADITYIRTSSGGFIYLALITDYYSRMIVGWNLSSSLALEGALDALKMALETIPENVCPIHHTDRGCQYYSKAYTDLLKSRKMPISMYTDGDPRNNAIAERINGTIKNEMLSGIDIEEVEAGISLMGKAIGLYNKVRPHLSLDFHTPQEAYLMEGKIERRWKTSYHKKINNENLENSL